ncbi:MAG: glycosyltransferase family 4 protein [Betaproteobacteria bacterium]
MKVAFVLKGYPRLSEAFIAQEIAALERRGLDILIVSLRRPTERRRHPIHEQIRARVLYLPEYLLLEPFRVMRSWLRMRRAPNYEKTRALWLRDLRRDPTPNRIRRFGQALVLAAELPHGIARLHAHFLHTPASVTRYAAKLAGLPWTGSAHAKDIWTTPQWEKREKLADCEWLVTCTGVNRDHLAGLAPAGRVELVYHGIDVSRFAPALPREPAPGPLRLLCVARLVEKKGVDVLLEALARVPRELDWRLVQVGGGPLQKKLRKRARTLGIAGRIEWRGARTQDELLEEYRLADLFVLASRVAADGDRDGIPNVLAEAQSQGLACVATRVSAIPELVRDGETGVLVDADDPQALAAALEALMRDPQRRRRLGQQAQRAVLADFQMEANVERLAAKFGLGHAHRVLRSA